MTPNRGEMRVLPSANDVSVALANEFADAAVAAIAQRGKFYVALSGGNTPRAAYELLGLGIYDSRIAWEHVFVYFGDERCVPPDDERSNYRMVAEALLSRVPIPDANVRRIAGEIEPGEAANEYAAVMRTELGNKPQFDLVLLGLGDDGHTASLFPGTAPATDDAALVRAALAPDGAMWRITITPNVINAARRVIFAVEGAPKAQVLAAVYQGPIDAVRYPAQAVAPSPGQLLWLVDEAAASLLAR